MKGPNIPNRWLAEKAAVFAIELADAFVSDRKACTRRVQTIQKHVAPRCLQPKLLLILKRTHRCQPAEMMAADPRNISRREVCLCRKLKLMFFKSFRSMASNYSFATPV